MSNAELIYLRGGGLFLASASPHLLPLKGELPQQRNQIGKSKRVCLFNHPLQPPKDDRSADFRSSVFLKGNLALVGAG